MRKLSCTVLLATSGVGPCFAQSSVTLYGVVDASTQYLSGHSNQARVQSGGMAGSRLGFRGVEDLGSTTKAVYALEMGFNVDDGTLGQGGIVFGRQAFVGLSDFWGELTLGRQYGSTYRLGSEFNAFGIGSAGVTAQIIGGFAGGYEPFRGASGTATPPAAGATGNGGPVRINNSVRYASPTWNGLQATAIVGLGEVAGATNRNRLYDLALRYHDGPVNLIAFYVSDRRDAPVESASTATSGLGATYEFLDGYKVYAGFVAVNDKRVANEDGRGGWIGGEYRWGPNTLRAEWMQNKPRYGSDNKTDVFGVGYQYDLSVRTALYSSVTRFRNQAHAGVSGLGRFSAATPVGLTAPGDGSISEFTLGLRHQF